MKHRTAILILEESINQKERSLSYAESNSISERYLDVSRAQIKSLKASLDILLNESRGCSI